MIDNQQCFLPSRDTALYCLDQNRGTLLWKYLAGGSLAQLPVITQNFVFQPVEYKSLLCLNRNDGSLRWELKNGTSFLAQNGPTTYAITQDGQMTLMNNNTGKRIASFFIHDMELYTVNKENAMIFLASKNGDIVAIKPNKVEIASNPNP